MTWKEVYMRDVREWENVCGTHSQKPNDWCEERPTYPLKESPNSRGEGDVRIRGGA